MHTFIVLILTSNIISIHKITLTCKKFQSCLLLSKIVSNLYPDREFQTDIWIFWISVSALIPISFYLESGLNILQVPNCKSS